MIRNYEEFCEVLLAAGFSMASGNNEGIAGVIPHGWEEHPPGSHLRWHTGDPDTDPWEWRIRVLDERDDIAYAKIFFKKGGYLTRAWAPYFLAARRQGASFDDAWADGTLSQDAKRVYETLRNGGARPVHDIKRLAGFGAGDKAGFDRALIDLQMGLFITLCGRAQKISRTGEAYGWASTTFCTTETFWTPDVFEAAARVSAQQAEEEITRQVLRLNPDAAEKKIKKFVFGA